MAHGGLGPEWHLVEGTGTLVSEPPFSWFVVDSYTKRFGADKTWT